MQSEQIKKEALFNEVKGSLFEYLVAKHFTKAQGTEMEFIKSIDPNYLQVLSQQDRMVRMFYPEMTHFLDDVSLQTSLALLPIIQGSGVGASLTGKFCNTELAKNYFEADIILKDEKKSIPVSLKLNKKNSFVNTKSAGIKSFFKTYFPYLNFEIQDQFNQCVDQEFGRMAIELHEVYGETYPGNFNQWVKLGYSELPGELNEDGRNILKNYYSRLAKLMHQILVAAQQASPDQFSSSLAPLIGFGTSEVVQVICFHDFKNENIADIHVHKSEDTFPKLKNALIKPFHDTSSVEISIDDWELQIRVKPMNKFTTTAVKINCSIKVRRPNVA